MKKRYVLGATALVLLGLGTSACSSQNNTDSKTEQNTKKLDKIKSTKNKDFKFKGNEFANNDGSMKFTKVTNLKVTDPHLDPSTSNILLIEVSFTNKSKKSMTPEEFFNDNFQVQQIKSNSTHTLGGTRTEEDSNLKPWENEINNGLDKLNAGKTTTAAFCIQLDKPSGDVVNGTKFAIQPSDSETQDTYGKPYKVTSATQSYTVKSNDSDSDAATDD